MKLGKHTDVAGWSKHDVTHSLNDDSVRPIN